MIYILSAFLVLSVVINLLMWWYIREYIKQTMNIRAMLEDFREEIGTYGEILEETLSMDIYYGEPTIENLVNNTKQVLVSFEELDSALGNILSGD